MTRQAVASPTSEELLAFEAKHPPKHSGRKETAIRDELGITPARFYQLLCRLIWTEEALQIDPMLTKRLRRQYEDRQMQHTQRQHCR